MRLTSTSVFSSTSSSTCVSATALHSRCRALSPRLPSPKMRPEPSMSISTNTAELLGYRCRGLAPVKGMCAPGPSACTVTVAASDAPPPRAPAPLAPPPAGRVPLAGLPGWLGEAAWSAAAAAASGMRSLSSARFLLRSVSMRRSVAPSAARAEGDSSSGPGVSGSGCRSDET